MSRLQLTSFAGLRADGRKPNECRRIQCKLGVFTRADGSASFEIGQTRALACVYGPHEADRWSESSHDRATIKVTMSHMTMGVCGTAPSSSSSSYRTRQSAVISRALRKVLQACVMVELFPRSDIEVSVEIMQSNGGELAAVLNAATLALVNAGIPLRDLACASSAAYVSSQPVLDLSASERSFGANDPEICVCIFFNSDLITLAEMPNTIPSQYFAALLEMAKAGCIHIHTLMRNAIKLHAFTLIKAQSLLDVASHSVEDVEDIPTAIRQTSSA